jgi:prepilin-type N-terminal cleavage/methylation domain-containing protein
MTRRRAHGRGFTSIELMVVVVVAGILLALALPSFNDMQARRRLEGQANELVTDLAYAKSEAVQRNRNVAVFTGAGGACYTVATWTTGTGSCNCTATPRCTGGPVELKTVTLSNSVTVTNGVTFDFEPVRGALQPVGATPAAAASAVVSLGTRNYTVLVTAYGRVTPFAP